MFASRKKEKILGINTDLFDRLVNSAYKNSQSAWKFCCILPSTIHLFFPPSNSTIHHKQSISSINKKIKKYLFKGNNILTHVSLDENEQFLRCNFCRLTQQILVFETIDKNIPPFKPIQNSTAFTSLKEMKK